jgi:RNA polymerase sigma-70 factor (ECF subfamily)
MKLQNQDNLFLRVLESHKGIIYKVANSYCSDTEDRKDLVQEIILQLWKSFGGYNEQFKYSTWIYRIALNVAISFYRKENRRTEIAHPLPAGILYLEADNQPDSESKLAALQRFISGLKEMDKALMLLYLEEKSQREISEILGITETNVSTRISRIKKILQQKFLSH